MSKNTTTESYRATVKPLSNTALTQEFLKQNGVARNYAQETFEEMTLRGIAVSQDQHK